eukprot:gb/GFBE01026416.1/.p1 GENE.gb/GFBE01026416.1/~~gb/GFBE01026416.1/.p1  ORF type:complete len:383 (+),score=71.78 gb/GFBE01026416.1/:1-1149(+)
MSSCFGLRSVRRGSEDEKTKPGMASQVSPGPEKKESATPDSSQKDTATPGTSASQGHIESKASEVDIGRTTLDSEAVFKHFDLLEIVRLGHQEGWLIRPNRVAIGEASLEHGGFGAIRRGKLDEKDIALKLPHHEDTETAKEHGLMRTKCICAKVLSEELRIFRQLEHPNIVKFYGATGLFVSDGKDRWPELALLLEWVDGGNLKTYVQTKLEKAASFDSTGLLHDVARGLAYLHGGKDSHEPIMHRDLKPRNVLVTTTEPPRAKICDFGLAVLMMKNCDVKAKAGTKNYMAPEVSSGEGYNMAADMFSFGCVIYFAMSGKRPQETVQEDLKALTVMPAMSPAQDLGVRCLEVQPTMRPGSREVVTEFDRFSGSQDATRLSL